MKNSWDLHFKMQFKDEFFLYASKESPGVGVSSKSCLSWLGEPSSLEEQ
jgi:hypothetical protein